MRKVVVGAVLVLVVVVLVGLVSATQQDTTEARTVPGTVCPTSTVNQLVAQTVPTATLVPCVSLFGGRWSVDGEGYSSDGTSVSMTGRNAQTVTWKVELHVTCDVASMSPAGARDGAVVTQIEDTTASTYTRTQALVFEGGCVTSTLVAPTAFDRALVVEDVDAALVLVPRAALDAQVRLQTDGDLGLDP
jgi:hypothetical protein